MRSLGLLEFYGLQFKIFLFPSLLKFANLACEQAHLRKNWGKDKKKGEGGWGREGEIKNEPARMTFNLESFAYHFSMLKS